MGEVLVYIIASAFCLVMTMAVMYLCKLLLREILKVKIRGK